MLMGIIQQTDSIGQMGVIVKLMDIKDYLQTQLFSAVLYRKIVVWLDLNITSKDYKPEKECALHTMIDEQRHAPNGVIQTLLNYDVVDESHEGFFSQGTDAPTEMVNSELAMVDAVLDLEKLAKKTFLYPDEKIVQFKENNTV